MSFTVLIPARLASTRLPNKPLADIGGQPMIVRVAQRVLSGVTATTRVVVAGDSPQIIDACRQHAIEAILTRSDHPSGSDRLAEACAQLELTGDNIVVNVQGDEPLMDPALVSAVADLLQERPEASMSTAAHPISHLADFLNPNVVKVVVDARQLALYFSRAPIPHWRDRPASATVYSDADNNLPPHLSPLRHIGIYGYRAGFLRQFPQLPQAPIEMTEALEQLRVMWHGYRIAVHITPNTPGPGVDTPEDLERVRRLFTS